MIFLILGTARFNLLHLFSEVPILLICQYNSRLGVLHLYNLSPYYVHFFWFTNWELDFGSNEYTMLDLINIAKYPNGIQHAVALRG
jgi:hypothetical protein